MKNKLVLSLLCATAIGGSAGWAATGTIQTIGSGEKWDSARQKVIGNFQSIESRLAALEAGGASTATAATSASPSKKAPPPPPPAIVYKEFGGFLKSNKADDNNLYTKTGKTRVPARYVSSADSTSGREHWILDGNGDLVNDKGRVLRRITINGKDLYQNPHNSSLHRIDGSASKVRWDVTEGRYVGKDGDHFDLDGGSIPAKSTASSTGGSLVDMPSPPRSPVTSPKTGPKKVVSSDAGDIGIALLTDPNSGVSGTLSRNNSTSSLSDLDSGIETNANEPTVDQYMEFIRTTKSLSMAQKNAIRKQGLTTAEEFKKYFKEQGINYN